MRILSLLLLAAVAGTGAASATPVAACPCEAAPTDEARDATVTLAIEGMHCPSCGAAVRTALTRLEGVKSAAVNYGERRARVTYDPGHVTPAQMIAAIERIGYRACVQEGG